MHHAVRFVFALFLKIVLIKADTYTVKIGAEQHVNLIDSRFLSFTIDPKYLFSTSGKYNSKECICMASSLTPAYIRIAGPSTALMSYHNSSITIDEDSEPFEPKRSRFQTFFSENLARIDKALHKRPGDEEKRLKKQRTDVKKESRVKRNHPRLEVSHSEWRKFIQWAKSTGFDLVFALNNDEKMSSGMWDPNMALNILTVAEKADVGEIFWQLGYECTNQSIEEYLNDLETLRVITETFPSGRSGKWKVVGGDVTGCLHEDSKSDFKDYVSLSSDMMDAILLNGNSSTVELDRMSERDRLKLLKLLSQSSTPLWLSERPSLEGPLTEMSRAADWLTSLGHAARNGFAVHYRELDEEEMFQPTLSFYMALLFKNLVGEKVLHVDMQPDQAIMFAHCTSLRHKQVSGAVTLYGVNMDDEPARFSIKLAKKEEGGDVMQFVIGHDKSGNVIVNGRAMSHEGDIKPVVKRVRPYKTLLVNLPAKSFGFWVLANTKIGACLADEKYNETENVDEAETVSEEPEIEDLKTKRSIKVQDFEEYLNSDDTSVDFCDENEVTEEIRNKDLRNHISNINKDISKVQAQFRLRSEQEMRTKRQTDNGNPIQKIRKFIENHNLKNRNIMPKPEAKTKGLLGGFLHNTLPSTIKNTKHNITELLKENRLHFIQKLPLFSKNKLTKRQSDQKHKKTTTRNENAFVSKKNVRSKDIKLKTKVPKPNNNLKQKVNKSTKTSAEKILEETKTKQERQQYKSVEERLLEADSKVEDKLRTRRNTKDQVDLSAENEIDINGEDNVKLWKMLRKIHKQFKDLSEETDEYVDDIDTEVEESTKKINTKKMKHDVDYDVDLADNTTFIKKTVYRLLRVVSDLNNNLNRFWSRMSLD